MKFKQSLLLTLFLSMLLSSASSYAGRQGINFFYGIGFGAAVPKDTEVFTPIIAKPDATATGSILFGFTEDGWSLEGMAFNSLEAGTDVSTLDYSIKGTDIGLSYRTIEQNNSYYKIKVSETDIDITGTDSTTNTSTTLETSGKSYTIGMGWRLSRENRLEFDYSYHSSDDFSDPVHMLTLSYLWGGAPYLGKSF